MSDRTHSLGVICKTCGGVLVPDDCACGTRHGHTYQEWNGWAARAFPDHVHDTTEVSDDPEVFCPDCFAGMESSEHHAKCIGWVEP